MRIAVANLTSGGLSGGYRKYLGQLMPLLAADPRVAALTIYLPAEAGVRLPQSLDVRTWGREDAGRRFRRLTSEVAALRPDVVFVPTARYANFGDLPVVTMVRNMEPLTVPFAGNSWAEGMKNLARAAEARRACCRARRVIAVSEHVRDFIVSRWGLDDDRVGTVYHGVMPQPVHANNSRPERRILFTAGSIRPARGLEDVVSALALLDEDVRLVISGGVDPGCEGYARRLRALAATRGIEARITWTGHLEPHDVQRSLATCSAFVMTSRAEACPNTALEAMSCGSPAVSVDRAPMPEFFRDAALYYPVGNAEVLARQLRRVITDHGERDRLSCLARRRAAAFSWEATRDGTLEQLERALA